MIRDLPDVIVWRTCQIVGSGTTADKEERLCPNQMTSGWWRSSPPSPRRIGPRSFGITRAGNERDFTQRPFAVWSVTPDLSGALAPYAARLELISENGTVVEADVVAGTFALESDLDLASVRRLNERLAAETATMDDKLAAVFEGGDEAVEKMRHLTVRVYDSAEALLYDGPALIDDEHWPVKR
jgi:hypothetical protein